MPVRAVCLEPIRVSVTQLALPERSALAIGVPGEPGSSGPAGADGALCRISGREQLNLSGMGAEGGIAFESSGKEFGIRNQ